MKNEFFDKINRIVNLENLMISFLWKPEWAWMPLKFKDIKTNEKTASLNFFWEYWVWNTKEWWYSFSSNRWWDVIDFVEYMWIQNPIEYLSDNYSEIKELIAENQKTYKEEKTLVKKTFVKHIDLWKKFESQPLDWKIFRNWLWTRWIDKLLIQAYPNNVKNLALMVRTQKNLFINEKEWESDVVIFPCYNKKQEIIWAKLRKSDWTQFSWGIKSKAIKWWQVWFLWDKIKKDQMIICEWEADFCVLKILWYEWIIANLWWASSKLWDLADLLKNTKNIISFIDNDAAWSMANEKLSKLLMSPLFIPNWYIKQNIPKNEKLDVNDLLKDYWCLRPQFDQMIREATSMDLIVPDTEIIQPEIDIDTSIAVGKDWIFIIKIWEDWTEREIRLTDFFIKKLDTLIYTDQMWKEIQSIRLKMSRNNDHYVVEFNAEELKTPAKFEQKVSENNIDFFCYNLSKSNLNNLVKFFSLKSTRRTYVFDTKWYIKKHNIWIYDNWIYSEKDNSFFEYKGIDDKIVEIPWLRCLYKPQASDRVLYEAWYYKEDILKNLKSDFTYLFCWSQWDLVLWQAVASLLFEKCKDLLTPFPILWVFWKKGSWKTTATQLFMKLFWFWLYSPHNIETSTIFIDEKHISDWKTLPLWRDEYKNSKKCVIKNWLLKSIYDRAWVSKWQKDLSERIMPINTSLIISGEQIPSDDAVLSRLLLITIKKDRRTYKWDFIEIQAKSDYYQTFKHYFLDHIIEIEEEYRAMYKNMRKSMRVKGIWQRLIDTYAPAITWIHIYNTIFLQKEYEAPWILIDRYALHIMEKENEEFDNDIINRFFGETLYLYKKWEIQVFQNYIIAEKWILKIDFNFLYNAYSEHHRNNDTKISKREIKNSLISELFWETQVRFYTYKEDWTRTRPNWMQITNTGVYEELTELYDYIQMKNAILKTDILNNK